MEHLDRGDSMSFCIILAVNSSGLQCRCILVLPTLVFYFILGSLLSIQVDFMDRKVFVVFFLGSSGGSSSYYSDQSS